MKKIIIGLLSLFLLINLSGCYDNKEKQLIKDDDIIVDYTIYNLTDKTECNAEIDDLLRQINYQSKATKVKEDYITSHYDYEIKLHLNDSANILVIVIGDESFIYFPVDENEHYMLTGNIDKKIISAIEETN